MFRKSMFISTAMILAMSLSACGSDGKTKNTSRPATVKTSSISKQVKAVCTKTKVISMVGVTIKSGYGSRTDKIVIACNDGTVGEVRIDKKR